MRHRGHYLGSRAHPLLNDRWELCPTHFMRAARMRGFVALHGLNDLPGTLIGSR